MIRLAVLASVALVGCADVDDRPPRWSYVYPAILQPACATAGCHSKLTALAGVDLSSSSAAYTILTGHICGESFGPPRNYITPGSAEYSTLIHQLRGQDRDVMPPDAPLPNLEIELIGTWIDLGAACD